MIENLSLFLNTHSSCADLWPMFFGQLEKHWPGHPRVVLAVNDDAISYRDTMTYPWISACDVDHVGEPKPYGLRGSDELVGYKDDHPFGQQYLQGLSYVTTDYALPLLEDFILIGDVDVGAIERAIEACRPAVRLIESGADYTYSFQPTVWRTNALLSSYVQGRRFATPWECELGLSANLPEQYRYVLPGCKGAPRGNHFDSTVFPYIATALTRGKWNSEYADELKPLHQTYGIDAKIRGWT